MRRSVSVAARVRASSACLAALLWLSACGGDGGGDKVSVTRDGGSSGGSSDGGSSSEAGLAEGGARDADVEGGASDGGNSGEGGLADGGSNTGGNFDCPPAEDVLSLPADATVHKPVASSLVGNTMHLLYATTPCTLGSRNGRGLRALIVPSAGEIGDPVDVINVDRGDGSGCVNTLAPAITAKNDSDAEAFYTAANTNFLEMYAQQLDPNPVADEPGTQLTAGTLQVRHDYLLAEAGNFGSGPFVLFASELIAQGTYGIDSMRPNIDFTPREVVAGSMEARPRAMAVSPLREDGASGVVAWLDSGSASPGVHVMPLDHLGASAGDAAYAEESIGAGADIDIAAREDGAAVVFSAGRTGSELRLLLLDADGGFERDPISLTFGNQRATSPSIAPFAEGYVVAYRSVDGNGTGSPVIRLMFLDRQGIAAGERNVAEAAGSGGQVRVEVANDGRILLAWPDQEASGAVVRVARLSCE